MLLPLGIQVLLVVVSIGRGREERRDGWLKVAYMQTHTHTHTRTHTHTHAHAHALGSSWKTCWGNSLRRMLIHRLGGKTTASATGRGEGKHGRVG